MRYINVIVALAITILFFVFLYLFVPSTRDIIITFWFVIKVAIMIPYTIIKAFYEAIF